ncbi:M57 family metalloprotease [Algoriphagus sp.]|uniref:M57 family metalloprotease n=1 Tax=Algoriphagus sp. TaxID=1872435 RepID=UPI003F72743B
MKTHFKKLLFAGIFAAFFSCDTEENLPLNKLGEPVQLEVKNESLDRYLELTQLKGKETAPFQDGYLIDGDIFVSQEVLENLDNLLPNTSPKSGVGKENLQYRLNTIVNTSPGVTRTITYRIQSSVPSSGPGSEWRTAIAAAFTEWNSVRNIKLNFQPTSGTANINITAYSQVSGIIASASLPSNGNPGNSIQINLHHNSLALDWKVQTLAHEIGHSIGFHHTDYNTPSANPNNIPGTIIPGTWNSDPNSIMNHQITKGWTGFPYLDQLSIRTLYPLDTSEKPLYAYLKTSTGGYNWTPNWSTYGFGAQGFSYWGYIGYVYTSPKSGTVPLYKYRHNVTHVDYLSLDPNLGALYPGNVNLGEIGRVYTSGNSERTPVYEWYHPNKGFYFTTLTNDGVVSSGGWTGGGIAFYTIKVDQFN